MNLLERNQKRKKTHSLEDILTQLSSQALPLLGTAIGAGVGGPPGAAIGGALGGIGSGALNAFMPQSQTQQSSYMDQPMVIGGSGQGFTNLDQYHNQSMPMQQGYGDDMWSGIGSGLGNAGGQGIMALLSLLTQQQSNANQSLFGKMDDSLREKLARMVALRQVLGR